MPDPNTALYQRMAALNQALNPGNAQDLQQQMGQLQQTMANNMANNVQANPQGTVLGSSEAGLNDAARMAAARNNANQVRQNLFQSAMQRQVGPNTPTRMGVPGFYPTGGQGGTRQGPQDMSDPNALLAAVMGQPSPPSPGVNFQGASSLAG